MPWCSSYPGTIFMSKPNSTYARRSMRRHIEKESHMHCVLHLRADCASRLDTTGTGCFAVFRVEPVMRGRHLAGQLWGCRCLGSLDHERLPCAKQNLEHVAVVRGGAPGSFTAEIEILTVRASNSGPKNQSINSGPTHIGFFTPHQLQLHGLVFLSHRTPETRVY